MTSFSISQAELQMVMHDFSYPLAHILTAKYWHNVHENSLHFTLADTGWGKAVWGKFYGQMIAGATVFVYDYEGQFKPTDLLRIMQDYHITSFCAPPTISLHSSIAQRQARLSIQAYSMSGRRRQAS